MLRQLIGDSSDPNSARILTATTKLVRRFIAGDLPSAARDFFASGIGIPLVKNERGDLRPIVLESVWRRLASSVALEATQREICQAVKPHQFSGIKGATDATALALRVAMERCLDAVMATLDFANAYNAVSRLEMLRAVARDVPQLLPLVLSMYRHAQGSVYVDAGGDGRAPVLCPQGVHQGDVLSPALFCLAIKGLLTRVQQAMEATGEKDPVIAYLDDVSLVGHPRAVEAGIRAILSAPEYGIRLKIDPDRPKCFIAPCSLVGGAHRPGGVQGLARREMGADVLAGFAFQDEGVKVLGTPIGTPEFVAKFLHKQVKDLEEDRDALLFAAAEDPVTAYHILRLSFSKRCDHLFRSVDAPQLCGAGAAHGGDLLHRGSDHHPAVGDHHDLVVFGHRPSAGYFTGAGARLHVDDAAAAAPLHPVLVELGALAVAEFADGEDLRGLVVENRHTHHRVAVLFEVQRANPTGGAAHGAHVFFLEADRHTHAGRHQQFTVTGGDRNSGEGIPIVD